jgi:hypothetical protein
MVKKRNIKKDADKLADEMADRSYGEDKDVIISKSIDILRSRYRLLEKIDLENKNQEKYPKSFSSLVNLALDEYLTIINC